MKDYKEKSGLEQKKEIAEELVPLLQNLSPEKRERVLGYAMGLADKRDMAS